jgi:hypothetical protein
MRALEQLAWSIYQRYLQNYEPLLAAGTAIGGGGGVGAEWWVQVRDATTSDRKQSAIDLQYDKDGALVDLFGILSFPAILTVPSLRTCSKKDARPTIVFGHTYAQPG